MERRGMAMMSTLLIVFVGVIAALALYQATTPFIGTATISASTSSAANGTAITGYTVTDSTQTDLVGQELLSTPIVYNNTGTLIPSTNYTIAETISLVDGLKRISVTPAANVNAYAGNSWNFTYDYGPEGYIESSGGRALAGLIAVFAALAIAVFALMKFGDFGFWKS